MVTPKSLHLCALDESSLSIGRVNRESCVWDIYVNFFFVVDINHSYHSAGVVYPIDKYLRKWGKSKEVYNAHCTSLFKEWWPLKYIGIVPSTSCCSWDHLVSCVNQLIHSKLLSGFKVLFTITCKLRIISQNIWRRVVGSVLINISPSII